MKICVLLVLNLIVFWIAYEYRNINKKKILFYQSANVFINDLIANINFNKKSVYEIFKANLANYNTLFVKTMQGYFINQNLNSECLSSNELNSFEEFIKSVGVFDVDGTINNLSFYKMSFEQKIELLNNEYKKKVEPIFKIIIILGLAISILII